MRVIKVVEEDIADKVDTTYILEQFRHIERVGIIYICTQNEQDEDDWTDEDGCHIVILLPYHEVKQMTDVRPLMVEKAKERLGLAA